MDMMKQLMAALVGSFALTGCLTNPNLVFVPQSQQADVDEDGSDDGGGDDVAWAQPFESDGTEPLGPANIVLAHITPQPDTCTPPWKRPPATPHGPGARGSQRA